MALVIAIRINIRSRKRFILYFLCQLEHPASLSVAASGTPHHCSDVPLKYRRVLLSLSIGFCCVYCHNIMMMYFGMNQDGMYFGPVSWHVLSCHGKLTFKFLLGPVVPAMAFKFKSLS